MSHNATATALESSARVKTAQRNQNALNRILASLKRKRVYLALRHSPNSATCRLVLVRGHLTPGTPHDIQLGPYRYQFVKELVRSCPIASLPSHVRVIG